MKHPDVFLEMILQMQRERMNSLIAEIEKNCRWKIKEYPIIPPKCFEKEEKKP